MMSWIFRYLTAMVYGWLLSGVSVALRVESVGKLNSGTTVPAPMSLPGQHRSSNMHRQCDSGGCKPIQIMFLWLLAGMACVPLIKSTYAFELPQEEKTTYLRLALGNPSGVVRKFSNTGPLAMRSACKSIQLDKCNMTVLSKKIRDSFGNNNRIEVKITSQNSDFDFAFVDANDAVSIRRRLSNLYRDGFIDSDDPDCQLYYSIKRNVIERVVIVVSLDSPELKQKLCLALQLSHGLGLALTSGLPFEKIWKQGPIEMLEGEKVFTERNVSMITAGYGVFSYIHMCPDIKPGMTGDDLTRILSGNSKCTEGLKHLP
jgi:hypothetical protein